MSINKRFAHLNHSGSNHSILDAESAYITGTLQVGPNIPVLGSDVNFFVSGAKDGEGGLVPGVGVFGGDLVVSGNLHFLGGITGSIPGGASYWSSPSLGVIKAEASSSLVEVPFLSSSNGAEITGSTTFNVSGNVNYSVVVSGANTFGQAPAFQVISTGINPGTVFTIDGDSGTTQVENNYDQYANPESGFAYTRLDAGRIKTAWSGSSVSIKADQGNQAEIELVTSGNTGFTNTIIRSVDEAANPIDLDLRIRALQLNGDAGLAGYALTSSGPGVAPGWAPFPTPPTAINYFYSETNDIIEASGSLYVSGGMRALSLSASNGAEISGSAVFAGAGGVTVGSDVVFFVSGANNSIGKAVFGGDLHVSGNIELENGISLQSRNTANTFNVDIVGVSDGGIFGFGSDVVVIGDIGNTTGIGFLDHGEVIALITGSNQGYFSGSYTFPQGITGSITKVPDGSDYLIAGTGITLTTGANGSITIDSTGGSSSPQWYYNNVDEIATSGSAAITGSLAVTGAAYFSPAGTGRGLLKFGGLDIGPITGSNYVASSTGTGYLSGSILSASNGVFDGIFGGTVRHEFHIIAAAPDLNSNINSFAATYLVMSSIESITGIQKVRSVTELSRETSGSYAANWDVNVTEDGVIELTSSMDSGITNIYWYGQRTKEMSINIIGSLS